MAGGSDEERFQRLQRTLILAVRRPLRRSRNLPQARVPLPVGGK